MQKRYDQALEFDQLRKVLREGEAFRGFEEAPIHFPPTYKYDVLKTLKAKRHKTVTRRILHRRAGSKGGDAIEEQAASARGCSADQVDLSQQDAEALRASNAEIMVTPDEKQEPKSLDGQGPEWGRVRRAAAARMRNARAAGVDKGAAQSEDDTSSVSSAWESFASVGFPHQLESDSDEPPASAETGAASPIPPADPVVASNTAAAQGRKVFSQGAAIKAKLRLLELVKTATGAKERETSSPVAPSTDMTRRNSRRRTRDSTSTSPEGRMPREYPMSPSQTVLPGRFSSKVATTDSANPSDTVPFDASLMDAASTRSSISSNFTMPALPLTSKAGSPSRQRASLPPPAKSAVGPVDIVKRGGGIRQVRPCNYTNPYWNHAHQAISPDSR